jgi:hypothetical protein
MGNLPGGIAPVGDLLAVPRSLFEIFSYSADRDIALTKLQVLQSAVRLRPPVRQLSPVLQESGLILDWLSSSAIADLGFPGIIGVIQSTASQTGWGESVGLDLGQNLANSRV